MIYNKSTMIYTKDEEISVSYNPLMVSLYCDHMILKGIGGPREWSAIGKIPELLYDLHFSALVIAHNGGLIPREYRAWGRQQFMRPPISPTLNGGGRRKLYPIIREAVKVSRVYDIDPSKIMIGDEQRWKDRKPLPEVIKAIESYLFNFNPLSTRQVFIEIWQSALDRGQPIQPSDINPAFIGLFNVWRDTAESSRLQVTEALEAERNANDRWGAW